MRTWRKAGRPTARMGTMRRPSQFWLFWQASPSQLRAMRSGVCVCVTVCVWCGVSCVCGVRICARIYAIMLFPCVRVCMCQRIRVLQREGILTCEFCRLTSLSLLSRSATGSSPALLCFNVRTFILIHCAHVPGACTFVCVYSRLSTCVCLPADTPVACDTPRKQPAMLRIDLRCCG